ncbi:MAG TPA: glycosyltransferase family 4 protein [Candidatus Avibacteroides excrementipullorum]|nr:glycosyltransferase family 4 protein [Candidatus Avibacteroides excrementipullorum]
MRNVVFFHPSSDLYGADKILIYIMKNFKGDRVRLVLKTDGPFVGLVRRECPEVRIVMAPSMPVAAKKDLKPGGIVKFVKSLLTFGKVIGKLKAEGMDVMYVNTLALVPVLFFFRRSGVKKIIHVHEIMTNDKLLHRLLNGFALKLADAVICVSDAVRRNLCGLGYDDKLQTVYNGISFKSGSEDLRKMDVDADKVNMALIGRIKPKNKGQILLLEAMTKMHREVLKKTRFYFVGSPVQGQEYMLAEVERKIDELGLREYVTMMPFVNDIEIVYRAMDVIIVPSVFDDPFPTTVLEGMYWGRPVIGTATGGIPEMIADGVTGFIAERDNPDSLADKITALVTDKALAARMGENGRRRFENNFTEEAFNVRFGEAVRRILD